LILSPAAGPYIEAPGAGANGKQNEAACAATAPTA